LRALIAKNIDNLLFAGRCISGDFYAHGSYRVTGNAVAMGQAVGILAAADYKMNKHPKEIAWPDVKRELVKYNENYYISTGYDNI
jgi:hypothetical protein